MGAEGVAFTPAVLALMSTRAAGRCEGCGRESARLEAHHRKFRSRGGKGTVENGVYLCGWGNHTGCHGIAHGQQDPHVEPREFGWALGSWEDPAEVPFIDRRGEIWLFLPDGTKITASEIPEPTSDPWAAPAVAADPWSA